MRSDFSAGEVVGCAALLLLINGGDNGLTSRTRRDDTIGEDVGGALRREYMRSGPGVCVKYVQQSDLSLADSGSESTGKQYSPSTTSVYVR